VRGLKRLRVSSIDSIVADEDLLRAIAEEDRLMPHLHLSLQAGDDMILKRMKRRHLRGHSIAFCAEVRKLRPDMVFGADIIAGFPTETDEMFENSLRIVEECGLTYLHVFPFSARPGTPAARMPQLPKSVIQQRARALREKGKQRLDAFLGSEVGAVRSILVETESLGRTEHFASVKFAQRMRAGAIVRARMTGRGSDHLEASLAA
jgi:threonylcarbamoyladenosine tRNA methylthiotransferase MtaB